MVEDEVRNKAGASMEVLPSGRVKFVFRQSWLGDALGLCLERGRLDVAGDLPRQEKDSAAVGTAAHAGIEYGVQAWIDDGVIPPVGDLVNVALIEWDDVIEPAIDVWQKYKPGKARSLVISDVEAWYEHIWPHVWPDEPIATEWHFEEPILGDEHMEIWLHGTMDLLARHAVWDWKTAGRQYQQAEKNRAVQSAVYTLISYVKQVGPGEAGTLPIPFKYGVMLHDVKQRGTVVPAQMMTVNRGMGDWHFLLRQLKGLAALMAADLPEWPLNDDGWWCSEKWCPAWSSCKGVSFEPDSLAYFGSTLNERTSE